MICTSGEGYSSGMLASDGSILIWDADLPSHPLFATSHAFPSSNQKTSGATEACVDGIVLRADNCLEPYLGPIKDEERVLSFLTIESGNLHRTGHSGLGSTMTVEGVEAMRDANDFTSGWSEGSLWRDNLAAGNGHTPSVQDSRVLERDQERFGMMEDDGDEQGGEACPLERALNLLPQQIADIEELARGGFDEEVWPISLWQDLRYFPSGAINCTPWCMDMCVQSSGDLHVR